MGKFKPPKGYVKKRLKLKDNHSWQAPTGYKILVLERGAVSINIPRHGMSSKPSQMSNCTTPRRRMIMRACPSLSGISRPA